jgi:hypothetical protein
MANTKFEASFVVRQIGENTGETFAGSFKCKTRLSHRDHLNRDQLRREYLGANPEGASERATVTAEMASQCAVRIIDGPSWWKSSDNGLALEDDLVLGAVYQGALKCEADAIAERVAKAEEAKTELQEIKSPVE